MRWIELTHRWRSGTIGLLLAIIGHRDVWTTVPHKHDAVTRSAGRVAGAMRDALRADAGRSETITFASPGFGVDRLGFGAAEAPMRTRPATY